MLASILELFEYADSRDVWNLVLGVIFFIAIPGPLIWAIICYLRGQYSEEIPPERTEEDYIEEAKDLIRQTSIKKSSYEIQEEDPWSELDRTALLKQIVKELKQNRKLIEEVKSRNDKNRPDYGAY